MGGKREAERTRQGDGDARRQGERERERESEWSYCEICWHRVQDIFLSQLRSWETPQYIG